MKPKSFTKLLSAAAFAAMLSASSVFAQVKIGSNPATIGTTSNLEVEATNNQKVIVNKNDGTLTIQNTPRGASTDSLLTIDTDGKVRAVAPVTPGIANLLIGNLVTGINVGACPSSLSVSGYFTSATCANLTTGNVGKNRLIVTFPDLGTTNYQVFSTNNLNTSDNPDLGNDVLLPLIFDKTATSFSVFLEETGATTVPTNFSFLIVK